jgi:hypothetical protein
MSLATDLLLKSLPRLSLKEIEVLEDWYKHLPPLSKEILLEVIQKVIQKRQEDTTLYRIAVLFTNKLLEWKDPLVAFRNRIVFIEATDGRWILPRKEYFEELRQIPPSILRIHPASKISPRCTIKVGSLLIPSPNYETVYPARMLNVQLPAEIEKALKSLNAPMPVKKFKSLLV